MKRTDDQIKQDKSPKKCWQNLGLGEEPGTCPFPEVHHPTPRKKKNGRIRHEKKNFKKKPL